jgi:import inner membrane translocase subunit TIM21
MTKRPSQDEFEYKVLAVDVKGELAYCYGKIRGSVLMLIGHQRIYLENVDAKESGKAAPKFFGVRWW